MTYIHLVTLINLHLSYCNSFKVAMLNLLQQNSIIKVGLIIIIEKDNRDPSWHKKDLNTYSYIIIIVETCSLNTDFTYFIIIIVIKEKPFIHQALVVNLFNQFAIIVIILSFLHFFFFLN